MYILLLLLLWSGLSAEGKEFNVEGLDLTLYIECSKDESSNLLVDAYFKATFSHLFYSFEWSFSDGNTISRHWGMKSAQHIFTDVVSTDKLTVTASIYRILSHQLYYTITKEIDCFDVCMKDKEVEFFCLPNEMEDTCCMGKCCKFNNEQCMALSGQCCSNERVCGEVCCEEGSSCLIDSYTTAGKGNLFVSPIEMCCEERSICGGECCNSESVCIDGSCCAKDFSCGEDECCDGPEHVCISSRGSCCHVDNVCGKDECCSEDQECVDGVCCDRNELCTDDETQTSTCCRDGDYCCLGKCVESELFCCHDIEGHENEYCEVECCGRGDYDICCSDTKSKCKMVGAQDDGELYCYDWMDEELFQPRAGNNDGDDEEDKKSRIVPFFFYLGRQRMN